jgi:DNA mismatch repair ATPase MutS
LANPEEIKNRQDAIEELMDQGELINRILPHMKALLDLERLLGK